MNRYDQENNRKVLLRSAHLAYNMNETVDHNSTSSNSNQTSSNDLFNCTTPQYFTDLDLFGHCYAYFFLAQTFSSVGQCVLIVGTVSFNSLLIISSWKSSGSNCVFNDILVGHALVDGITGLIDIPLYHIYQRFGYWPLGATLAKLWLAYDGNINITTTMHMMYATYARLRSIMNPQGYKYEALLKKPYLVMGCFWAFGLSIWIPIVFGYGIVDYTNSVNIQPAYIGSIVNLLTWLMPLVAVFIMAIVFYVKLILIIRRTKEYLPKNMGKWKRYRLAAQFRFLMIVGPFIFQWILPSFVTVAAPFLPAMDTNFTSAIYWYVLL